MDSSNWRFKHVGLITRDLDDAYDFFSRLGFGVAKEKFDSAPALPGNPKSRIAHLKTGGVVVELIQPVAGEFVNMDFLKSVGDGVNHICFEVDDLEEERRKMRAEGIGELYGSPVFAYFDTRRFGNMIIELVVRR